ncbi:MAG: BrnA antitoxin family protein [Patescibacteria group bacterium]
MKKKFKKIPKFRTENEERKFWDTHSSVDYIDWSKAKRGVFPNLKLTSKPISLRLPVGVINQVKIKANKMDVPYQSLIKQYIAEGVQK